MPSAAGPSLPPSERLHVDVQGGVPAGLSGRLLGIGPDGVVHCVDLHPGRSIAHRTQQLRPGPTVENVLVFGGAILAFGEDAPARELSTEFDRLRVVDLAGRGHTIAPFPKYDPVTGELHLVARARDGTQTHVIITAGALTRRVRPIMHAPRRIIDLALTPDRIVFAATGLVGIAPRDGEARVTWLAHDAEAPHLVHARDADDAVVVLALTPSLERWTFPARPGTVERTLVDPVPRRLAVLRDDARQWVWTAGGSTINRHELVASGHDQHTARTGGPDEFIVVADPKRPDDNGGGWLVGFGHRSTGSTTDLLVIDAADIAAPALATVHLQRAVPRGIRCAWIPSAIPTALHSPTSEHRP